jgi:DNA gyrase subunit A
MSNNNPPQEKLFVENLINRPVEEEITQSYIEYAMSVIVSRALPDVRDGLKPVLRRILYAMYDMGLTATAKHKKSAAVVWEVLGKYHPHGDSSVYDAMVRLAQPFAMRYPMVNGQGNFWSVDGDEAAAMRYTEARLTKLAEEMLDEINQATVDRRENYDQTRKEPIMLPTKFPYTLCNGTMGIAVGMATNMPPNNLSEVIDACLLLIDNPEATIDQVMECIKGPDFPTWGMIFDSFNIKEVYTKGRGSITMRGKHHLEKTDKKEDVIVLDELPYQVNKANLVAKIGELANEKKLEGIYDITDESSKNLMRVAIHLRKWTNVDDMLTRIYKYTDLQTNFSVNNVALIEEGRQPRHLNILELLHEFVTFRRIVVRRRSEFQLDKAKSRLHILEWLQRAIDILDAVIETIKSSQTREEAKSNLMEKFDFSDEQSEYILMLRLQTLVGLEIQKILGEIGDKKELISYLEGILADQKKLDAVVIDEMIYMKDTYGDERKTELVNDASIYDLNTNIKALKRMDEMIQEPVITWIGGDYKIKVLYQSRILNIPQETFTLTKTHNQDKMIAISDRGELVIQRLKDLGKFTVQSEALDVVQHFGLKSTLVFSETLWYDFDYLVMITNQNTLKKIDKELLLSFRKFPTTVMGLESGEKIIKVLPIKKTDQIGVITEQGRILIFDHNGLRPMGKTAAWVKAIALQEWDKVADIFNYADEPFIFIHDDQNGKMVSVEDLLEQKRGPMRRAQPWVTCAYPKPSHPLRGAIAIVEGAVNLLMENGRIDLYDSNKMDLCMPEDELTKITNGKIVKMRRPWGEKESVKDAEEEKVNQQKAKDGEWGDQESLFE